jgi:predicted transposase YbfD/YdcC
MYKKRAKKMDLCVYTKFFKINASITYIIYKSWIEYAFIMCSIHVHFPIKNSLSIISFISCNSTIASIKERQEHNN